MFESVEFDGKGYAWGRNGRFVPRKAEAMKFNSGEVEVSVESKRTDGRSPMVLRMSGPDAVKFAMMILRAEKKGRL